MSSIILESAGECQDRSCLPLVQSEERGKPGNVCLVVVGAGLVRAVVDFRRGNLSCTIVI